MSAERVVAAVLALAVGVVVLTALAGSRRPPDGPVPVAWDREACAHCRMHVGEPGFAVQLQHDDGTVLNFDDPTCYFAFVADDPADAHAVYFHHRTEARWLPRAEVGFLPDAAAPMGGGFAAVDAGTPDALSYDAALRAAAAARTAAPSPAARASAAPDGAAAGG